nr:CoA transferase [Sphingobium boeckii]
MAAFTTSSRLTAVSGTMLLGERAALNGFVIPGRHSCGGGCRLFDTRDAPVALTLARPDDRTLLPALFGDASVDPDDNGDIAQRLRRESAADIVARGRVLGLAMAALDEHPVSPAATITAQGLPAAPATGLPLVIDLSALWAGPLAAHLLDMSGAQVIKVESVNRPDRMRQGDPALFARLNQDKANVALDLRQSADRDALIALIRRADIVIEAARPRALLQLGIDADRLVTETPGLVWVTITGHGAAGDAAQWIGFGDDCSVGGGLSAALHTATGATGFGGDACADPLTGIYAARAALTQRTRGVGARLILSMSGIVAEALSNEGEETLQAMLIHWAASVGQPFPAVPGRIAGSVAALGADTAAWLASC